MVPWKIWEAGKAPHKGLVLYWFPATNDEIKKSSLRASRLLTLYSSQCVTMTVADAKTPELQPIIGDSALPVAILASADGAPIKKIENTGGKLKVDQVEKVVEAEMKQREATLDTQLKDAKEKIKAGDKENAIALLKPVAEEKCLFPKKAKDAASQLKKLGVGEVGSIPAAPILDRVQGARIEAVLRQGLRAEIAERYVTALRLYQKAHQMDPRIRLRCVISASSIVITPASGSKRARLSTDSEHACRCYRTRRGASWARQDDDSRW